MNAEQFCYWLKGSFELAGMTQIDQVQVQIIKDHLNLVFKKETPNRQISVTPPVQLPQPVKGPTIVEQPRWQIPNWNPDNVPTITC
jgi:hypothetical protein